MQAFVGMMVRVGSVVKKRKTLSLLRRQEWGHTVFTTQIKNKHCTSSNIVNFIDPIRFAALRSPAYAGMTKSAFAGMTFFLVYSGCILSGAYGFSSHTPAAPVPSFSTMLLVLWLIACSAVSGF